MPVSAAVDVGVMKIDTSTTATDIPWNPKIRHGELIDGRDGQLYKTVTIGPQTWMAENLNYRTDSSCWVEKSADSGALLGRSYRWTQALGLADSCDTMSCKVPAKVQGVCPSGWHIPTSEEWKRLTDTTLAVATSPFALKAARCWGSESGLDDWYWYGGADSVGFRILRISKYMVLGPPAPETTTPEVLWRGISGLLGVTKDGAMQMVIRSESRSVSIEAMGKQNSQFVRCLKN
ncbi:MAG: hypothetical protein RL318_3098 [Fibrobacterota bacterium]|jgi:uncharacterized protein (TIGR02145 family)